MSGDNRPLREFILHSAGKLSVLCAAAPQIALWGDSPDLFLLSGQITHLSCNHTAFVVRSPQDLPEECCCTQITAILDSANDAAREAVAQRRLPALTCGLSGADTFTFSSLTADSAVISLRRPIGAADGSTVDPFELPVSFFADTPPFSMLACAAVFCLLGAKNPLLHLSRWTLPEI